MNTPNSPTTKIDIHRIHSAGRWNGSMNRSGVLIIKFLPPHHFAYYPLKITEFGFPLPPFHSPGTGQLGTTRIRSYPHPSPPFFMSTPFVGGENVRYMRSFLRCM